MRFLNELVLTLNRPANQTANAPGATLHLEKPNLPVGDQIDFAQNLDDPDSLWRRPPTVYEIDSVLHPHDFYSIIIIVVVYSLLYS